MGRRCYKLFAWVLTVGATFGVRSGFAAAAYTLRHPCGNVYFTADWVPADGLALTVANGAGDVVRVNTTRRRARVIGGHGDNAQRLRRVRTDLDMLPDTPQRAVPFVVKLRSTSWTLYCNGHQFLQIPPPLQATELQVNGVPLASIRFQKTADIEFRADFMIPENQADVLPEWTQDAGSWRLHSAHEAAVKQKTSKHLTNKPLTAKLSPNFYSLQGKASEPGAEAIITTGYMVYDDYWLKASTQVRYRDAGLVAYYQDRDNFYAFTGRVSDDDQGRAIFTLWRRGFATPTRDTVLAAVSLPLTDGQWVMPKIIVGNNRIRCELDQTLLIDVTESLPPGGRFGLYTLGDEFHRFDDVSMASIRHLELDTAEQVRFHTIRDVGSVFKSTRRRHHRQVSRGFTVPAGRHPRWIAFGATAHSGHFFSATFDSNHADQLVGIICGYKNDNRSYLRFSCKRGSGHDVVALQRLSPEGATTIEQWQLPTALTPASSITLAADGTVPGQLRLYRGRDLVIIYPATDIENTGASGIYVADGGAVRVSGLTYAFERPGLTRNRYEKNRAFVTNEFMRHWSSPEGNWIEGDNGYMWHKSDFFGRFVLDLPVVDQSDVHLGVPEDATAGAIIVRVREAGVEVLSTDAATAAESADWPVRVSEARSRPVGVTGKGTTHPEGHFQIHYEGYWVWITADEQTILKYRLDHPLTGTRICIRGVELDQLATSHVERYQVSDYLFTEAPHDWTMNGGRWQVINRFQCDPRWSHLNGENRDGRAAMWSKYKYSGDFCVELYAGIRHGEWYYKSGGINVTMMNAGNTPSRGYTVTCGGWDANDSQLWNVFYRNGAVVARSDELTIPRYRDGHKRRHPELAAVNGRSHLDRWYYTRPIHGAWYYIKFRRRGQRLEYYFDNERIFSHDDNAPIESGQFGLWTFLNSIVLARVTIAADDIQPVAIPYTPVTVAPPAEQPLPRVVEPAPDNTTSVAKLPYVLDTPERWNVDDPVGRTRLSWHTESEGQSYFVATNILGGGPFMAVSQCSPILYDAVAGFRMDIQRTNDAQFNFHYDIGTVNDDGDFVALRKYYHRLSGTEFNRGEYHRYGQTPITPNARCDPLWHTDGEFQPVTVWLPSAAVLNAARRLLTPTQRLYVRVVGFGNRQASDVLVGLFGNGVGAAYAVRGFAPIYYQTPTLTDILSPLDERPLRLTPLGATGETLRVQRGQAADLQQWLAENAPGFHSMRLAEDRRPRRQWDVHWLRLPDRPHIDCDWSPDVAGAVRFRTGHGYPDRRMANADVTINGVPVAVFEHGDDWLVRLPRTTAALDPLIRVIVRLPTAPLHESEPLFEAFVFRLKKDDERPNHGPVLMRIDGAPLLLNFEDRCLGLPVEVDRERMRLGHDDREQGTYLEVFNTQYKQRLRSTFRLPFSVADYPLFQFRYRATELTKLTLHLGVNENDVILNEEPNNKRIGVAVRYSSELRADEQWHTWFGCVSDTFRTYPFATDRLAVPKFSFLSRSKVDQTGRYSYWFLDDLVLGPAVSEPKQLVFTPRFFDEDGVDAVFYSLQSHAEPYANLSTEAREQIRWHTVDNHRPIMPDFRKLDEGVCRLYLKARDHAGNVSPVTDIPFLYDHTPLATRHGFQRSRAPGSNGTALHIVFDNNGASPLALSALRPLVDGKPVVIEPLLSRFRHERHQDTLELNWPYILRHQLNTMLDGDQLTFSLSHIRDGAGNISPDVVVPITVKYSTDHTPPALLAATYSRAVMWSTAWGGHDTPKPLLFTPGRRNSTGVQHDYGEEPYIDTRSDRSAGALWRDFDPGEWGLAKHPYLSFRVRLPVLDGGAMQMRVVLNGEREEWISLFLARGQEERQKLALAKPIPWEDGTWHNVTINLLDILEKQTDLGNRARTQHVTTVGFHRIQVNPGSALHLQSLFVHGPWTAGESITIDGYDASGIAGVFWQYIDGVGNVLTSGRQEQRRVEPASLNLPPSSDGWLLLHILDNAGHRSRPLRVPCVRESSAVIGF